MASVQSKVISLTLKKLVQSNYSPTLNIDRLRWDDFHKPGPASRKNCSIEEVIIHDVPCFWMSPDHIRSKKIILYFHGGGFVYGPTLLQWRMLSLLSKKTGIQSIMSDYRKAPEHPYPASIDDMMHIYEDLLLSRKAEDIIFMGDSAGGGLALSLAMKLRDMKKPLPYKMVLLSPWLDVTMKNPLIPEIEQLDQMLAVQGLIEAGKYYSGDEDPLNPYISPLFGSLEGLPPILLQIGTHDMLLCDCRVLKEKADESGVHISYREWDEMFHVWMLNIPYLPEAREAISEVEKFLSS